MERLEPRVLLADASAPASELLDDIVANHPAADAPAPTKISQPISPAAAVSPSGIQFPSKFVSIGNAPTARFEGYNFVLGGKLWCTGGFDSQFQVVPGAEVFD